MPNMRARASLLGLAVCDALGATNEFRARDEIRPITGMVGGGVHRLKPGQWTDDTSMALCLAESLATCGGFDAKDQMTRYLRWYRTGYMSSTGACFDIGGATRAALERFEATGDPMAGNPDPSVAGNGSLMRLAPVALYFASQPARAIEMCGESSRTTHASPVCIDACRLFGYLILKELELPIPLPPRPGPLEPRIEEIANRSYERKRRDDIHSSGFVVHTLEAALWCLDQTSTFRDGALLAANLGDDADTVAAVYGQIAGIRYGVEGIPEEWLAVLAQRERIESIADRLGARAFSPPLWESSTPTS